METESILDRVKRFLPVMKEANEALEMKIKQEGMESVRIDQNLTLSKTNDASVEANTVQSDNDHSSNNNESDEEDNTESTSNEDSEKNNRMINIEFAIGDFDDTLIAKLEKDEENNDINEKTDN